jgi:hypothetical protein
LHNFCTVCDAYMRFYWGIYLETCKMVATTQRGHAIHPLDLTKSESSTCLSTKVPSLVPVVVVTDLFGSVRERVKAFTRIECKFCIGRGRSFDQLTVRW